MVTPLVAPGTARTVETPLPGPAPVTVTITFDEADPEGTAYATMGPMVPIELLDLVHRVSALPDDLDTVRGEGSGWAEQREATPRQEDDPPGIAPP